MFTELTAKSAEEIRESISITLSIVPGWENATDNMWQNIPSQITARIGTSSRILFSCYSTVYDGNLDIGLVKPAEWLIPQGSKYIDFYLGLSLTVLENYARRGGFSRLFFESEVPTMYDHILDQGYTIFDQASKKSKLIAGYKILK